MRALRLRSLVPIVILTGSAAVNSFSPCAPQAVASLPAIPHGPEAKEIRFIARALPGVPCDAIQAPSGLVWRHEPEPLFNGAAGAALPASMRALCVIRASVDPGTLSTRAAGKQPTPLELAARSPHIEAVEEDRPIVGALAACAPDDEGKVGTQVENREKNLSPEIFRELRHRFLDHAGFLPKLPPPRGSGVTPWIGVLDSADPSEERACDIADSDMPSHGKSVARVIQHLLCTDRDDGACLGCVRASRVLPLAFQGAPSMGARRGDLARSIVDTVHERLRDRAPEAGAPLILNLSIGWEPVEDHAETATTSAGAVEDDLRAPRLGGMAGSGEVSPGSDAVFAAMMYAACHGALIIAAAGNDPGFSPPLQGPVLPAAWERAPRPTAEVCAAHFDPSLMPSAIPASRYQPLLYAVGGVSPTDRPLPVSRKGGLPRLAAPGSLAVAFHGDDPPPDARALTGTSMAAAVVSATAAAVWSYRPELTGPDVMDLVYHSGKKIRESADFCVDGPCDPVRRVSLCEAIKAACAGPAGEQGACPAGIADLACATPRVRITLPSATSSFPCQDATCAMSDRCSTDKKGACDAPASVAYARGSRWSLSGQPEMPACPDCTLSVWRVDERVYAWDVDGWISPSYFDASGTTALEGTTLQLYADTIELGRWAVTPEQITEETAPKEVEGADDATGPITMATLTWVRRVGETTTVLTQEIPVVAK